MELKPCPNPWCEGLEDIEHREGGFFRVGCVCGVAGPAATDEATAIKLWNTRAMADPDTLRPREALVEAREALALGAAIPLVDSRCSVEVTALCDTFGYGAVMSTASVLWRELLKADGIDGGEFCAGPCRGTAESVIAKIDAALTAHIKEEGTDGAS